MKKNPLRLATAIGLLCLLLNPCFAQKPNDKYGLGGVETVGADAKGNLYTEIHDAGNRLRERSEEVKVTGFSKKGYQITYYDCNKKKTFLHTRVYSDIADDDGNLQVVYEEMIEFDDQEIPKRIERRQISDNGMRYEKYDPAVGTDGKVIGWSPMPAPNTFPSFGPPRIPKICDKDHRVGCLPGNEFFGGYSYLSVAQGDGERESLPVGAHLSFTHSLTKKFGLVADISYHTKKKDDVTITRSYLTAGLQYDIVESPEERRLKVLAHLLAGLANDKFKYSFGGEDVITKEDAFVIAFGLGLGIPVNRKIMIGIMADYLIAKFAEEWLGDVRVSAGVRINLNCK